MVDAPAGEPGADPGAKPARRWWTRAAIHVENAALAAALFGIVLLPLAESLLRATLRTGISGSTAIAQHLTLVVGTLGGAVAAREDRLLSLAAAGTFLRGRWKSAAALFGHAFGAGIAAVLAIAGGQFAMQTREAGGTLVYGIPNWVGQSPIPIGFGLVALRLVWRSSRNLAGKAVGAAIAASIVWIQAHPPDDASRLVVPGLILLGAATLAGAPIFVTLGGAAAILFFGQGEELTGLSIDHYSLVTNPSLPSIPLFALAGYLLAEGGASGRLVRVFQALFGGVRGGPAIVTALLCAFFTTFTGASGVTILALAGLLMPILLAAKYSERSAIGLLTGSGSLGLLFPPCLPMILYAIVAKVKIEQIFLGGILPGCLLVGLTAWWGVRQGPRIETDRRKIDFREAGRAMWAAKWELLLPVVAMGALFGGFATPVEASAITALYAFVVETFVYRDLSLTRGVPKVLDECGLVIGGVLMILGVAKGFTSYLIFADVPTSLMTWVTNTVHSPLVFLLILNLFLLLVGCLMDIFSAIVVVVPLIVPIGEHFQIDPVHLGIVFLANLELGYLMPPVGMNLLLASYRLKKPVGEVYRAALPMILVLLVGVLLITYLPGLTTWLPRLFGSAPGG
jgi:tripartite ATP-independent transporter DctM subunit